MFKNIFVSVLLAVTISSCGGGGGGGKTPGNSSALQQSSASVLSSSLSTTSSSAQGSSSSVNQAQHIQTWWHNKFDANSTTAVADDKVRRSTVYDVKVATVQAADNKSDSFVYMTLPRGGKVKDYVNDDGAEFAKSANLTMSWSSFLYDADVWIQIDLKDGKTIDSIDKVLIRPTTLEFEKELVSATSIRIKVPYSDKGYKFSVEFEPELMTARSTQLGTSGSLTEDTKYAAVHTEPRNALLIFAEPMLNTQQQSELIPTTTSGTIFYPNEGPINLSSVSQQIVYFKPGIYSMPANSHANLPANVRWVYLAPGAYVKGAFQFNGNDADQKLTGFGVISGEKYVYAPDKNNSYKHSTGNCDANCLRLLQFTPSGANQTLTIHGITINEPPFNSFVVFGNSDSYKTRVSHYKQVGSWYYQTDGVESYNGGFVKDSFFHSNDDVLKMYHSNTTAENIVIWKGENGPVIQFGWASRNMSNILVKDIDVIHNRMYWKDQKSNTCILNATDMYSETPLEQDRISTAHTIKNVEFRNIRSEGKNLCAMRIVALSNWESIFVNGLDIESWNDLATDSQASLFRARTTMDASPKPLSIGSGEMGLRIENYKVAGKLIQKADDSWKLTSNGRIAFDNNLNPNWTATGQGANCVGQAISFSPVAQTTVSTVVNLNATASSGLPIAFSLVGGEGEISGTTLSTSATSGLIAIKATAGNDTYCETSVIRLITVNDTTSKPADGRWIGASWASWSPSTIPMAWSDSEKLFKVTVTLGVGEQQMKFTNTNNWSGDDWAGATGLSGVAVKTTGGGANIIFSTTTAGSYTIRFNPYSLAYSITKD